MKQVTSLSSPLLCVCARTIRNKCYSSVAVPCIAGTVRIVVYSDEVLSIGKKLHERLLREHNVRDLGQVYPLCCDCCYHVLSYINAHHNNIVSFVVYIKDAVTIE